MKNKINLKALGSGFDKSNIFIKFNLDDFFVFNKKFCGVFIYKGKKAYSIKLFDYFLEKLKKSFLKDPTFIFFDIVKKLVPFFVLKQKKQGKRIVYIPTFARFNKKNRFILDWLFRQLKNRSNIYGVKSNDVLNLLIETYKNRGSALRLKKEFYRLALSNRYNLRRKGFFKKYLLKWNKENKKKEWQDAERVFLLNIMSEEKIKKRKKRKDWRKMFFFFLKKFKKKSDYRDYLVR